jgi:hypothetical protein
MDGRRYSYSEKDCVLEGVKVFSRFWGGRINFIVRILDAIITRRELGNELLNF